MSQSSYIAAMLLAGFVLFIAAEGRLSVYVGLLTGGGSAGASSTGTGSSDNAGGGILGTLGTLANIGGGSGFFGF